jgi:hypothetical protein
LKYSRKIQQFSFEFQRRLKHIQELKYATAEPLKKNYFLEVAEEIEEAVIVQMINIINQSSAVDLYLGLLNQSAK